MAAGGSAMARRSVSGVSGTSMSPRVGRSRSNVTSRRPLTSAAASTTVTTPRPTSAPGPRAARAHAEEPLRPPGRGEPRRCPVPTPRGGCSCPCSAAADRATAIGRAQRGSERADTSSRSCSRPRRPPPSATRSVRPRAQARRRGSGRRRRAALPGGRRKALAASPTGAVGTCRAGRRARSSRRRSQRV